MPDAPQLNDADGLYSVLKKGTPESRREMLAELPQTDASAHAAVMLKSGAPLATVLAFSAVANTLCKTSPSVGGALALATHRYAVETYDASSSHSGLEPIILSRLAADYVTASNLIGDTEATLEFCDRWIPYYTKLGQPHNLAVLKLARVQALIKSQRLDEARDALADPTLKTNAAIAQEVTRLKQLVPPSRSGVGLAFSEADDVHEKPPASRKPAEPPKPTQRARPPATRDEEAQEEFELGVGRGPRAKPPEHELARLVEEEEGPTPIRVVSNGFADLTAPGGHRDNQLPLEPGKDYLYWLEVGPPVAGAIDKALRSLPKEVPREAELTVALFAPADGFVLKSGQTVGRLQLKPDGTARVIAQPRPHGVAPAAVFDRRLLFDVRAPQQAGVHRLRSSIYCDGVLVQSRIIEAYVGKKPKSGEPALVSDVDYTLSDTLSPGALNELGRHQLSIMMNSNGNGSHDFYFYAGAGTKPIEQPATISAGTLDGLITQARVALKMVSWEKGKTRGGEWDKTKTYRYAKPGTLDQLRDDFLLLASRGYDIYDAIAENLAGKTAVTALETALKAPGLLQIAGKQDIRYVLPAALIYDYPFDSQKPDEKFELCPVFVDAFQKKTDLVTTACFQGACPSRGKNTVVCPSGFWGFRHAIGLPISLPQDANGAGGGRATETAARVRYKDVPVMVLAVSLAKDLTQRAEHEKQLRKLQGAWADRGWFVGEHRDLALQHLATDKPHLVYFYCHGGLTEREGKQMPYLSVGDPDEDLIVRSTLRASQVRWDDPRPLVFINGCHTTALDANAALDFVTGFVQQAQACGVIGTEITIFEQLACDFATKFWSLFLQGQEIGRAIQRTRLDLLQAGNPLGLVYTPFVLAGTKLEKIA